MVCWSEANKSTVDGPWQKMDHSPWTMVCWSEVGGMKSEEKIIPKQTIYTLII